MAHNGFLQNERSVQAQVVLLQETQKIRYVDGSSVGLGMLRSQRGSNGRGPKAATAVKQPRMKFVRATVRVGFYRPDTWKRADMQGPYGELRREVNKEINHCASLLMFSKVDRLYTAWTQALVRAIVVFQFVHSQTQHELYHTQ